MLRPLIRLAAFAVPLMMASVSQAAVWRATNTWDLQWERAFGKFINELPLDYFTAAGMPYQGMQTDCADAAYALRIIFAYDNKLPVDFYNHGGRDLSNTTTQFDNVPEGRERLKKFINTVRLYTDTGTLISETYPIAINRHSIIPGTMFLHSPKKELKDGVNVTPKVYASAHVFYIQNIAASGLVTYISSTVPIAVRNLNARIGYVFSPFNVNSGYRAWKWPGTRSAPLESRINGSTEQFQLAGWETAVFVKANNERDRRLDLDRQNKAWSAEVRKRLQGVGAGRQINPTEELNAVIGNILGGVQDRIAVVQNGWKEYQNRYGGRGCMREGDYDNYSTPSRDTRIQHELLYLAPAATRYVKSKGAGDVKTALKRLYANYRFEILPGKVIDLNQVVDAFLTNKALSISEPEHSPEARWGLTPMMVKSQWACPQRADQYYGAERINR